MPDFRYVDMLPKGEDETPYRLITTEGIEVVELGGRQFLHVAPETLRTLTFAAMRDIQHLLRPGHLQQLRNILDDPEASANDRFVALDLLRNANIAAGGVLPMCQDTGTAIVVGKRGQQVLTQALSDLTGVGLEGFGQLHGCGDRPIAMRSDLGRLESGPLSGPGAQAVEGLGQLGEQFLLDEKHPRILRGRGLL